MNIIYGNLYFIIVLYQKQTKKKFINMYKIFTKSEQNKSNYYISEIFIL
jgi:hypothetical protein